MGGRSSSWTAYLNLVAVEFSTRPWAFLSTALCGQSSCYRNDFLVSSGNPEAQMYGSKSMTISGIAICSWWIEQPNYLSLAATDLWNICISTISCHVPSLTGKRSKQRSWEDLLTTMVTHHPNFKVWTYHDFHCTSCCRLALLACLWLQRPLQIKGLRHQTAPYLVLSKQLTKCPL